MLNKTNLRLATAGGATGHINLFNYYRAQALHFFMLQFCYCVRALHFYTILFILLTLLLLLMIDCRKNIYDGDQ